MLNNRSPYRGLVAVLALAAFVANAADTPNTGGAGPTAPAPSRVLDPRSAGAAPAHYHPDRFAGNASKYYWAVWGVDSLNVRLVESGQMIRFSYRVLDPNKAKVLNEKDSTATLIAPEVGVSLVVPTMEKIGQLRQAMTPEAGRSYWVAFSNRGRLVKRGDRVDVVIGNFQAKNLVVD